MQASLDHAPGPDLGCIPLEIPRCSVTKGPETFSDLRAESWIADASVAEVFIFLDKVCIDQKDSHRTGNGILCGSWTYI